MFDIMVFANLLVHEFIEDKFIKFIEIICYFIFFYCTFF